MIEPKEELIKLLVIEDDREDFLITKDIVMRIKNANYTVDWESDFASACQRIGAHEHDVYIVDYNLGPHSGIELVKHCISRDLHIPYIFLTGTDDLNVDMEAMAAGATDFLVKGSLTPDKLERSIRYSLKQKRTERALTRANIMKDKLFSIISHDLRSPLSTLMSALNLITEHGAHLTDAEKEDLLNNLSNISKNAYGLLENLLYWSRSQIDSLLVEPLSIFLHEFVDENVNMIAHQAAIKKITLNNTVSKSLVANADKNLLGSILRNLLSNAVKYSYKEGVVEIGDRGVEDGLITLYVKDHGMGMAEADKEAILDPFKFISTYGTNRETGSGLGLKIVHEFVQRSNGTLWAESKPGKGSTFYFTLPAQD